MSLLLKGCNVIDATTPEVRRDRYVLIEGEKIAEVGSGRAPSADRTLDLGGAYLLPGLWDVHTHLRTGTWTGAPEPQDAAGVILSHGQAAMDALRVGVTSMRVVGVQDWADVAWMEWFDSGRFMGPRLFCCGHALRGTAGHMAVPTADMSIVDGPAAFVKAVRNQIKHGVNQIKLITTGGIMGTGHDVMSASWPNGELSTCLPWPSATSPQTRPRRPLRRSTARRTRCPMSSARGPTISQRGTRSPYASPWRPG